MGDGIVPRGVTARVLEALADTPVVVVNGPRQAGKTTLVRTSPTAVRLGPRIAAIPVSRLWLQN